jgi:transposase
MLDLLNLPGVRPVDLQSSQGVITITAEVIEATPPACPECSKPLYRHGHRRIEFADTPQQMQPVRLVIDRPRYRCESCGKTMTLDLPFLDERRRATQRLVGAIRERCLGMTFRGLAEQTGLAVNTIKNIAQDIFHLAAWNTGADIRSWLHWNTRAWRALPAGAWPLDSTAQALFRFP